MALFVVLASKKLDGSNNEIERHIGKVLPKLTNEEIIALQADCDELDYIISNFPSVPLAYHTGQLNSKELNRVQKWFGDDAKFIYHNLHWRAE